MHTFFDITPQKKGSGYRDQEKPLAKKSKGNGIYYLIIMILLVMFFYSLANLSPKSSTSKSTAKPNNSPANTTGSQKPATTQDNSSQTSSYPGSSPQLPQTVNQPTDNSSGQVAAQQDNSSVEKTKINIKVLNGSGTTGAAQTVKDKLEEQGFSVSEIGTAKNIYNSTVIYYTQLEDAAAKLVADALTNYKTTLKEDETITKGFDLVVVVGKK